MPQPNPRPADNHRTVNDVVNDAIQRWVDVTQTDPARRTFRVQRGQEWSDWSLWSAFQELEKSRDLDPTGVTTFMLLRGMADSYLKDVTFRACDVLADPASVERRVAPLRELAAVLEHPLVTPHVRAFEEGVRAAAAHHGLVDLVGLDTLLADRLAFASVRRDALRSFDEMTVHQFAHGRPSTAQPAVSADVMEFWNMQSLLRALDASESVVLMALVRDPVDFFSYFCVAVRCGDSVTVVTDRDPRPHPDFTRQTRRPDRALERRIDRGWFPYQFLDVRVDESSERLFVAQSSALVPVNATGVRVGGLRDLLPAQFVWALVVFELAQRRFGRQNERLPELSYTADMVADPNAYIGSASDMVIRGDYKPLDLGPVAPADLAGPNGERSGRAQWMIDRYGARVPAAALNLLGAGDVAGHTEETALAAGGPLVRLHERRMMDSSDHGVFATAPVRALRTLDPTTFGTRAAIQGDRLWVAKQNRRAAIETLALREFEATRVEVVDWFRARCEAKVDRFVEATARQELTVSSRRRPADDEGHARRNIAEVEYGINGWPCRKGGRQPWLMPHAHAKGERIGPGVLRSLDGEVAIGGGFRDAQPRGWLCYRSGALGTAFARFQPRDAGELCSMLEVDVGDLPWQLAHWFRNGSTHLGSIHTRVDHDDMIASPWDFLQLDVHVVLGRGAYNAARRALGLPPVAWEEEFKARRESRR